MADYSDFQSMGTTYSFSKGPKSLYYGKGDQDLFAIVLNVPQQDDDDEWGGTERIAMERIADEIGALQEYVSDPAGGGTGLLQRVTALESVLDASVPQAVLGDVTISGTTNSITIGSGASLDAETLQLGGSGSFLIDEVSANRYDITYKTEGIRFFDDGVTPTVTLAIGATSYIFGASSFVVPAITISGDVTVTGDVNATNGVFSGDIAADVITAATINATALVAGTATICGTLTTESLVPDVGSSRNVGTPGTRYLGVAAVNLNVGNAVSPTFTVTGATGDLVTSGTISSGAVTVSGDILPATTGTIDLGDPVAPKRFAGIAATTLNLSGNIIAADLDVNDINMHDLLANDIVANTVTICGATLTLDGAALNTNAAITATGANITSTQVVSGARVLATEYFRLNFLGTAPTAIVGAVPMWYDALSGTRTHVFIREPGGTIRELDYV